MITDLTQFKALDPREQILELEYLSKLLELTYRYDIKDTVLEQQVRKLEHYLMLGYSELDETVKL
jgi:hypothetical protein